MVPDGWSYTTLGSLVTHSAFGPRFSSDLYAVNGTIGTIRTTDLSNEGIINYKTIPYADLSETEFESHILKTGDLLITRSGTCGIPCIFEEQDRPIIAGAFLIRFVLKKGVNTAFVHTLLNFPPVQHEISKMASGGVQKNLTGTSLKKLELLIPKLEEQQKIAQIQSTWDKAISTTERLIDNSKQQKRALSQQILKGQKKLFDDCGQVFDGRWREVKLEDVVEINPGKPPKPTNGNVSFIPMDAVSEEAKLLRQEIKSYQDVVKGFTSFVDFDVIVAKITPCFENGKGAYLEDLCNGLGFGSTEFHVLRAKQDTCPKFIYFITQTKQFRVKGELNMQGSAGQKRVTTNYLKLYKLSIPPTKVEQQKIAKVLTNADKEIQLLEKQLADLKQEKKALMQQLLTGKRRVKVDEQPLA